jgi:hypothetical protein
MGLAAIAVLAILVQEVSARIYRGRAERLLHDIRQLQVGRSTFEDARAVIVRNGGGVSPYDHTPCSPAHCTFDVALRHYPFFAEHWARFLSLEMLYHVLRMFPPLGLQDGWGGGAVRVEQGMVTSLAYAAFVRGAGGWVMGRNIVEGEALPKYLQDHFGKRAYYLDWFNITTEGGGEGIESRLTPQANAEERKRAYDFDFDCLTKLGGCTSFCQLAPAAFADYVKQTGRMPWLDEHDPNCAKLKPLAVNPDDAKHP